MSTKAGGIQWLIEQIQKIIVGKKSAKIGVGLLVAVTDMAVANNTVAIIINGSIAKKYAKNIMLISEKVLLYWIYSLVYSKDLSLMELKCLSS